MADAFSDRLGLLLMEEGTHSNEWGDLTNLNLDRLDSAARGFTTIALAGAQALDANDITTVASTAQEESFFSFIEFTGTAGTVTVPAENIVWTFRNKSSGSVTVTPSGGTGVAIPVNATRILVYGANGTTMTDVTSELWDGGASGIVNTPSGNLVATDVQAALDELQTEIDGIQTAVSTKEEVGVAVAMAIALG